MIAWYPFQAFMGFCLVGWFCSSYQENSRLFALSSKRLSVSRLVRRNCSQLCLSGREVELLSIACKEVMGVSTFPAMVFSCSRLEALVEEPQGPAVAG